MTMRSSKQVETTRKWKAEQEKQRREHAIANTTGLRVLAAVSAAVPVRLMKRDLIFIVEKLVAS
jgi:ParB family chromosome partitioning protein